MAKISTNILYLDYSRKKEIIERTKEVKSILDEFLNMKNLYNRLGFNFKLEKSYSIYKRIFNEELTVDERTILYLYVIFPSDIKFLQLLKNNENNFSKLAQLNDVPVGFVKLRYNNLKDMLNQKKYLENVNKLIKKQ